jgi:hypothetical protein
LTLKDQARALRQKTVRRNNTLVFASINYLKTSPPIWRGERGLWRLGGKRRVQQIANCPNPISE